MTQEQKQFITKALQTGIPAIAQEHIKAVEEVARVERTKQEDLNGQEDWEFLNQHRHSNIVETLRASVPFMADEYIGAYFTGVSDGQQKFLAIKKARLEKEAKSKKGDDNVPNPEDEEKKKEGAPASVEKKKKTA